MEVGFLGLNSKPALNSNCRTSINAYACLVTALFACIIIFKYNSSSIIPASTA